MMRRFGLAALVLAFAAPAAPVSAEGWSIYDIGRPANREACMAKAQNVIDRYIYNYGGGETSTASWTNYGYDLRPGDQDAVIMCPLVNGVPAAFLTVHGSDSEEQRIFTADEIERYWKEY